MKKLLSIALLLIGTSFMGQVQKRTFNRVAVTQAPALSTTTAMQAPAPASTAPAGDIRIVTDIKTLRTTAGVLNDVVYVKYHTYNFDNGGGFFMWRTDATLTDANNYFSHDNNGTIIKVAGNTTGRWVRQYSGYVSAAFFGITYDNATQAIQNAIDFCWHSQEADTPTKGSTVFIAQGGYMVNNILLRNGVAITGDTQNSTILYAKLPNEGGTQNDYLLSIMPGPVQTSITNISIVGRDSNKGCFHFKGITPPEGYPHAGVWNSAFKGIGISGFKNHGIYLEGGDNGRMPNQFTVFENVTVGLSKLAPAKTCALKITGQQGQITFLNSAFNGYDDGNMKFHTGHVVDISHVETTYSAVISFINATFQEGDYGLYINYAENITVDNCWFENLGVAVTVDGSWHECQGISILGNRFANAAGYGSLDIDAGNIRQGTCVNVINSHATIANNYATVSQINGTSSNNYFITASGINGEPNMGIELYGNSHAPALSATKGITQAIAVTNGVLNAGYNKLLVINGATTPVTTINSNLNAGETLTVKSEANGIIFQPGPAILLPNTGGLILNKGEIAGFTKLDIDGVATYQLTSLVK